MNHKEEFNDKKYTIIRDFFSKRDVERIDRRLNHLKSTNQLTNDPQCPLSLSVYGDPIHSEMQEVYRSKIERILNINLYPTYTYSRIYSPRETLKYHMDRPSCEISLTVTLSYDTFDNKPWPIFVETDTSNPEGVISHIANEQELNTSERYGIPYYLYPGDILIYNGDKIAHWREPFVGITQNQVFMHYVNKNGKYHEYKYDFRPSLGSSLSKRDEDRRIQIEKGIL
jgi:hypothetical protein